MPDQVTVEQIDGF